MFLLDSAFYEPSPPVAFRYLRNGNAYSVRPQRRGNREYWYMHKRQDRKYLGAVGSLSAQVLNEAVAEFETQGEAQ